MLSKKLVSLICAGASVLSVGLTTLSAEETDPNQSTNAPTETNQADQDAEASASAEASVEEAGTDAQAAESEAPAVPVMGADENAGQEEPANIEEKFDNTEGTIVVNSEEAEKVVLPAPERDGYTFLYWNSAKDGSGTVHQAGDEFTIGTEDELYAIWEKDEAKTIFYVEPDGENVIGTNEVVQYQKAETEEEKANAVLGNPAQESQAPDVENAAETAPAESAAGESE